MNHGINTYKSDTNFAATKQATVGIPIFIGAWPCHAGTGFKGKPQIARDFDEAKRLGGYSTAWRDSNGKPKWNLCQAVYSHFVLFRMGPAVFYNVYDPANHKKAVEESSYNVTDHIVTLSEDAIADESFTVKAQENTLNVGTDYLLYYENGSLLVELLESGTAYSESTVNIAYNEADVSKITSTDISAALEKIELCKGELDVVPDLICAPGWSSDETVAAVMALKAANINGLFGAKAIVDLSSAKSDADSYSKVLEYKNQHLYTDENMVVCWPLARVNGYLFDLSTIVCGCIASVDYSNSSVPYESPSNKSLPITAAVTAAGDEVNLTMLQADAVSYSAGVVTVLNFDGWRLWGNYTGAYPASSDVAKVFICCSRMTDFLRNAFVNMYIDYVDKPLCRPLIDAIVNNFNGFLAGLTQNGMLYGGEIAYVEDNNSTVNLLAGKFRLDSRVASPVPAQQIDIHLEYDVATLNAAINI